MTVFEPITSQHFETTLLQNNLVSNTIKRDHWIAIKPGANSWQPITTSVTSKGKGKEAGSNQEKRGETSVQKAG